MAWILLALAGALEVVWATTMKLSDGFTRPVMTGITVLGMIASVGLLSWAMRSIPLGTAYPVWTGIGAVGAFALGVFVMGETASALRICGAALIVGGIGLLKIAG